MENNEDIREKILLEEVKGKNMAIHAYDKIIWTVRSGYLTIVFLGWAVIIQSLGFHTNRINN